MDDIYIDLLEAAFPYISPSWKHPAAIFLKVQEILKVIRDYDADEMIGACSLDSGSNNIELMLNAMKARATPEIATQIDTLLNAMKMLKVYQNYQDIVKNLPPVELKPPAEDSSSSNDMLSALLNDLIQKNNGGDI